MLRVWNQTRQTCLAERTRQACTWKKRLVGLMGASALADGEGMWLQPCSSIHTFWMRFPLDVVFVSQDRRVLHTQAALLPWRVSRWVRQAAGVLELPVGVLQASATCRGDQLVFECLASQAGGRISEKPV